MNVDLWGISLDYHLPVLSAGGSQVRISAKGIEVITGAKFEAKAGQHVFSGGQKVSVPAVNLPKLDFAKPPFSAQYQLFKADGRNFQGYKYYIHDAKDNLIEQGLTDSQGLTTQVVTQQKEAIIGYKSVMRESERITENWEAKLEQMSKKVKIGQN